MNHLLSDSIHASRPSAAARTTEREARREQGRGVACASIGKRAFAILILVATTTLFLGQASRSASTPPTEEILVANYRGDSIMAYAPGANGDASPAWLIGRRLTPMGLAKDTVGRIYVTNYWVDSLSIFASGATGAAQPVAVIRGSKTGLDSPAHIAVDRAGKIYVVNGAGDVTDRPAPGTAVGIAVYAAGASGNVAPIAVISGDRTRLEDPQGVAVDSTGRIYVTDLGNEDSSSSPPRIMVYPADSNGNVAPIVTIGGDKTGLTLPNGIAVDPVGKIYVINDGSQIRAEDTIVVYSPGANGNITPAATIGSVGDPQGIAVDSAGKIYVTNLGDWDPNSSGPDLDLRHAQSVTIYSANADGEDASPMARIRGPLTGLDNPQGVMVGDNGEIYVASCPDSRPGVITVYPAGADGNVKPAATITDGADTELNFPRGIAVNADGQIYVANESSITVYPKGTNRNVPPLFKIAGAKTGLTNLAGITLDTQRNIYVTQIAPHFGTISVFDSTAKSDTRPDAIITFHGPGPFPSNVVVDPGGNMYVASFNDDPHRRSVYLSIYPPDSHGLALPIAGIHGLDIYSTGAIALDSYGRIYVADPGFQPAAKGSIKIYPGLEFTPYQAGRPDVFLPDQPWYPNVPPVATISGAHTELDHPQAIALDSGGKIYVLNGKPDGPASITVYRPKPPNASGNFDEEPEARIAGLDTALDMDATSIAVWDPPPRRMNSR